MYGIDIVTGPTITSPSAADAAAHLALGDLYDAADLAAVLLAAATLAREMTGRSVGQTSYRLYCAFTAGKDVLLPYPSESCAITSVTVDGAAVSSANYSLVRQGAWWALKWITEPSGERLEVAFAAGEATLEPELRSLVLILCGDLYRSRESSTPGTTAPASITAERLAWLQRLYYPGPYS